jgi:hypothetical protein
VGRAMGTGAFPPVSRLSQEPPPWTLFPQPRLHTPFSFMRSGQGFL